MGNLLDCVARDALTRCMQIPHDATGGNDGPCASPLEPETQKNGSSVHAYL